MSRFNKQTVKNSLVPVLTVFPQIFGAFVVTKLMLDELGADMVGLFAIVGVLMGFGGLLTFGAGDATLRLVAKYRALDDHEKLGKVIRCSSLIFLLAGVVAALFLYAGNGLLISLLDSEDVEKSIDKDFASKVFSLAGVGLLFFLPASGFKAIIDGFERLDLTGIINTIFSALEVSLQFTLLYLGHGLISIVTLMVVARTLLCLTLFIITCRLLKGQYRMSPAWDGLIFKEAIDFGIYLWLGSIFNRLWNQGLPLIVGAIIGLEAVGIYTVAMKPILMLIVVIDKTTMFLFPYLTGVFEKKQKDVLFLRYEQVTCVAVMTGAAFCGALVFLARPFVEFWLEDKATETIVMIIQILAIRFAVHPASMVASHFMRASKKTKSLLAIQIVSSITLMIATVIGAYTGGLLGVALGQFAVFGLVMFNRSLVEKQLFAIFRPALQLRVILGAAIPSALMWLVASTSQELTFLNLAGGFLAFLACATIPFLILRSQANLIRQAMLAS